VTLSSPLFTQVRHVAPNTHDSYYRRSRKHGYISPGKHSRCEYCLTFVFLCTWQLCHVGSRGEVASSAGGILDLVLRSGQADVSSFATRRSLNVHVMFTKADTASSQTGPQTKSRPQASGSEGSDGVVVSRSESIANSRGSGEDDRDGFVY